MKILQNRIKIELQHINFKIPKIKKLEYISIKVTINIDVIT